MNTVRLLALIAIGGCLLSEPSPAQLLSYNFSNQDGAPAFQAPGVSGSDFLRDPDHFISYTTLAGNPAPAATSGSFDSLSFDSTLYYTFTITAVNALSITSLSFDVEGSVDPAPSGPTNFAVRYSLDGFSINLGTGLISPGIFTHTEVAVNRALSAGTNVEFRIYGYGATDSGGQFLIDNVLVVPEPSSSTLCTGVLLAAGILVGSRRLLNRWCK